MTSIGNSMTSLDAILKEYYRDGGVVNTTFVNNPLWALLTKKQHVMSGVGGRSFLWPVKYATSQGRSALFSSAQTGGQTTSTQAVDFIVPNVTNYQYTTLSSQVVLQTRGNRNAFVEAVTIEMDGCLDNLGRDMGGAVYGDGTGIRGTIGSSTTLASSQLVLAIADSSLQFEVGMQLDLCAAGTQTPRAFGSAGHGLFVIGVDRINGILTIGTTASPATAAQCNITDAVNGIPTAAITDGIYVVGDENAKVAGLSGWLPYGGPSSAAFMNVVRTTDPTRLAGQWLDGSQLSIEDAFIQGTTIVAKQGGGMGRNQVSNFFVPFNKYSQLLRSQAAKTIIDVAIGEGEEPDVSFPGVELMTAQGTVQVLPDNNCLPNRMFGLDLDTWKFLHVGPDPVSLFNLDGLDMLRTASADGLEIRFYSFGAMVCEKPGSNIVINVNP
jgi:hypothetical protein